MGGEEFGCLHVEAILKILKVAVPPGIGDSLWSITKIPHLRRLHEADAVIVAVKGTSLNRSQDFLSAFTCVDRVIYEDFPIHPPEGQLTKEGPYLYIDSQQDWKGYDWLLISNGHLERGNRLEDWLPEIDTDFTLGSQWVFNPTYLRKAQEFRSSLNGRYAVFYLGPYAGNTRDGHNRGPIWSVKDWCALADSLHHNYGLKIVLVGAEYDKDFSDGFMLRMRDRDYIIDLVGETPIGLTYSYILYSEMCVSYQSGIGIFSVYLGVPTVLWWRPYGDSISPWHYISFKNEMATAWAPPWSLENGRYLAEIYGDESNPQRILNEVEARQWIGSRGEPEFRDDWTLQNYR